LCGEIACFYIGLKGAHVNPFAAAQAIG